MRDCRPFQTYVSLDAPDEATYRRVCRPADPAAWELVRESLALLGSRRSAVRTTLVAGLNDHDPAGYGALVADSAPTFVEVKGYMHLGYSRKRLTAAHMPSHERVRAFAEQVARHAGYRVRDENVASRVVVLEQSRMRFNVEEWRERSRCDFEGAWHAGPSVLTPPGSAERYPRLAYRRASRHPVFETIHRLREAYLSIGFSEYANPIIVEEAEVYRQFGPEAMAVLDRVFYLGGLPRPNVGIARERLDRINGILGTTMEEATEEALREALHGYKKGTIDGDELAHELACVLSTDDARVVRIMDEVFPEFRELAPESTPRDPPLPHDERLVHDPRRDLGPLAPPAPALLGGPLLPPRAGGGADAPDDLPLGLVRGRGRGRHERGGQGRLGGPPRGLRLHGLPVPARREAVQVLHARLADRGLRPPPGDRLGRGRDLRALLALGPRRVRRRRAGHEPRASAWSGSRWS